MKEIIVEMYSVVRITDDEYNRLKSAEPYERADIFDYELETGVNDIHVQNIEMQESLNEEKR